MASPAIDVAMSRSPHCALAVVDMQEDFCTPNGSLAISDARGLAPFINDLLAQSFFVFKLATQDFHPPNHVSFASQHSGAVAMQSTCDVANPGNPAETMTVALWPDHCVHGTTGATLIPEIDHRRIEQVIQKGRDARFESLSGFGPRFRNPPVAMTELNDLLHQHGITHLFVVGVGFDGCVKNTAMDAAEFGYHTSIILDGVNASFRQPATRTKTLADLRERGVKLIHLKPLMAELVATDERRRAIGDLLNRKLTQDSH